MMWGQPPRLSGQGEARPNCHGLNMRMRVTFTTALATLLLTSCSPRDFLTRRLASDLISASSELKTPQRFVLRTGIVASKDYPSPEYLVLQHHAWISANPAPCPRDLAPPPCWDILVTPSGVDAVRAAMTADQGGGSLLAIPVARRELVGVNGIAKQGNFADVDFTWRANDAGYRVRTYVPYGSAWYPYLVRRLAERPANLRFFARSLVRG